MLPFLQPKKITTVIVDRHRPAGTLDSDGQNAPKYDALLAAADELITATHARNARAVAEAFKAAFEICGSYENPNEEYKG